MRTKGVGVGAEEVGVVATGAVEVGGVLLLMQHIVC